MSASDPHFRMVKDSIPPEIEETGVLLYEPLGDSQDPVRFHFIFQWEMILTIPEVALFDFDGIDISK
jgi:hypothetical protein